MRLILLLSLAFSAVCFAGDTNLSDFDQKTVLFPYGSWYDAGLKKSYLVPGQDGVATSGEATSKGGACTRGLSISATADDVLALEITVLEGNKAKAVNVLLENEDGTQAGWRFDITDLKPGSTKKLISEKLSAPSFVNPQTGTFDPKAIVSWHVQGDYSDDSKIRVRFDHLVIRSQE